MNNRIIKFRAWDESQNYMVYQGTPDLETLQSFIFHFGDKTLMQFTGLFDKNGKEIYEGDIVDGEVFAHSRGFKKKIVRCKVVFRGGSFTLIPLDGLDIVYFDNCEVIGNIYENNLSTLQQN